MNACILEHQIQSSKGYTDSDMAGDLDNRKSTIGYLFTFSGGAISWLRLVNGPEPGHRTGIR